MASFWYDKGILETFKTIDLSAAGQKIMLCTATAVSAKTDTYIDDGSVDDPASGEISVTGYTGGYGGSGRKAIDTPTVTNPGSNQTRYDAANPTWTTLGTGATITQAIVVKEVTADTSSPLIVNLNFTGVPTNGGDFTVSYHANGIGYANNA
jgi:hypothetical protein